MEEIDELIKKLWVVCQHANDLNDNYRSVLDQRENIKVVKEVIRRLKEKEAK